MRPVTVIAAVILFAACTDGTEPDRAGGGSVVVLPEPTREKPRVKSIATDKVKVWPRSAPVQRGVTYSFTVEHCGLTHLTDFDGSFWEPIPPDQGKEPSFFINGDRGTMTLVADDSAEYVSSDGTRVTLTRHEGPKTVPVCY